MTAELRKSMDQGVQLWYEKWNIFLEIEHMIESVKEALFSAYQADHWVSI